jgi:hypothetical protein
MMATSVVMRGAGAAVVGASVVGASVSGSIGCEGAGPTVTAVAAAELP